MWVRRIALAAAGAMALTVLATPASAGPVAQQVEAAAVIDTFDGVPSEVPASFTPDVENGQVNAIALVGNQIVLGGTFTSVTPRGGGTVSRSYVMAFNATTGALNTGFAPVLNNVVEALEPAPDGTSVFVGGHFTTVNGATQRRVTRLRLSDGGVVGGFSAPASDGRVETLRFANNRLFVGGAFVTVGGAPHAGFVTLNASTGALDPYMDLQISGHHNDSGSGAQGAVRVDEIAITPDGTTLIAIGNFKRVNGLLRDQIVRVQLGTQATVHPNWSTNQFSPYCFSWAFDSWIRGVDISPDGSYFVVATTGGPVSGTLCDTATRWEMGSSGLDVRPTWVNATGGDTLWGIEASDNVVFVGGHQRWNNNPRGGDSAQPGAVPSPGLMGLDPISGEPLSWNPGRNPRGAAVFDILATADGVWLGSDTEYIGNVQYRRKRVAFFPRTGGTPAASQYTGVLPGEVYIGGRSGDSFTRTTFNGSTATALQNTGIPGVAWSNVRGAVQIGDKLFYGYSDSRLYVRTFNGSSLGAATLVDPYHDPYWLGVGTGSGSTTYTGVFPSFYGQLPSVTGMFYSGGKLFYTRSGQSALFWRWFTPDSGAVSETEFQSSGGINWSTANGMFLNGTNLYVVSSTTGQLSRYGFSGGVPSGPGTVVNSAIDWRGRAVFLYAGVANQPPAASFTTSCESFTCTFNGSASSDQDGSISSYAWNFGDGASATGATASRTYTAGGTYTVTLTVTDNRGATGTTTRSVTVPAGALADIQFRAATQANGNSSSVGVAVPPETQPGDALVLFVSSASSATPTTPAGWTSVNTTTTDVLRSTLYRRIAAASDAGSTVTVQLGAFGKTTAILSAYSGVDAGNPVAQASFVADAGQTTHTTPQVNVADGAAVVSYWVDRSSATETGWTVPAAVVERIESLGSGGGRHTAALADYGTPVGPGTFGGVTATAAASSSRAVSWSVVLTAAQL